MLDFDFICRREEPSVVAMVRLIWNLNKFLQRAFLSFLKIIYLKILKELLKAPLKIEINFVEVFKMI